MTAAASASAPINHHTQVGGELVELADVAAAVVLVDVGLAGVSVGVGDSSAALEVGEGAAFAADVELARVVFAADELTTGGRVVADVAGGGAVDVATAGVVVCGGGSDEDRVIVGRFGAEVESSIDVSGALGVDGALDVPGRVAVGSAIERDGVPGTDSEAVGRSGRLELQDVTAAPVPTTAASTASNTGFRPNLAMARPVTSTCGVPPRDSVSCVARDASSSAVAISTTFASACWAASARIEADSGHRRNSRCQCRAVLSPSAG